MMPDRSLHDVQRQVELTGKQHLVVCTVEGAGQLALKVRLWTEFNTPSSSDSNSLKKKVFTYNNEHLSACLSVC